MTVMASAAMILIFCLVYNWIIARLFCYLLGISQGYIAKQSCNLLQLNSTIKQREKKVRGLRLPRYQSSNLKGHDSFIVIAIIIAAAFPQSSKGQLQAYYQ